MKTIKGTLKRFLSTEKMVALRSVTYSKLSLWKFRALTLLRQKRLKNALRAQKLSPVRLRYRSEG